MKLYFFATALLFFLNNFSMEVVENYERPDCLDKIINTEKYLKPLRRICYASAILGGITTLASGIYLTCAAFLKKEPELSAAGLSIIIIGSGAAGFLIYLARKELRDREEPF